MDIPIQDLPGFSKTALDYLDRFETVKEFFNGDFRKLADFRIQAKRMGERDLDRETVAAVLEEQNRGYGCGPKTLENIKNLSRPGVSTVVTGQQAGLFSGPLYTIYKTLTTIKLAGYLNQNLPGGAVPVFWMASEDHDFAEIDHFSLIGKDNRVETIRYLPDSVNPGLPAWGVKIEERISECFRKLEDLTHDTEYKPGVLSDLYSAYRPGISYTNAFAAWLTRMFQSDGLIIIDGSHPELKRLGKPVFIREIEENSPSTKAALKTSSALSSAGYSIQVSQREGILNLFYAEGERRPVHIRDQGFAIGDSPDLLGKQELLARVDNSPQFFSPNVLLRPVYQDYILPTAAYVAGPGEIAYFAQLKGVYQAFNVPMPVIYPRKSVTLLEKKIETVLTRYDLRIPDFWRNADRVTSEVLENRVPAPVSQGIGDVRARIERDFLSLRESLGALDPTLEKSVDTTLGKINYALEFLEKKMLQSVKKQNSIVTLQLEKAGHHLFPANHLQERELNIVPYLFKYGYELIERLGQIIDITDFNHQVIELTQSRTEE